ncbi:MAG: sodium-dependent bicarbonate transport family permease, partial [Actinobacteria bacterium]|nr:sodium-dependent bicarbonate transport family permease [Actinomycetota bacterium]
MHLSLDLALHNLASVAVLAFALGALAARVRTDVQLPPSVYTFLSIYLLFGIGLKGGVALRDVHFVDVAIPSVTTLALGAVIPVLAFGSLKWITRMSALDRGAVAAHYGSTSLVTFSAVLLFLDNLGVQYEGFTSTLLTIMEVPGIVVGIALGLRGTLPATTDDQRDRRSRWRTIAHETLLGRTAFMLIGGLI